MLGRRIGSYEVKRRIGRGGMGEVYEAVHTVTEGRVAIKVLLPEHSRDPAVKVRFVNEARAANIVPHAAIVRVEDCGQLPDGQLYLVMEYLDGESLEQRLTKHDGCLPVATALPIINQVAQALAAAHERKVIHRDLKPSNLMLVPDPIGPGGERVKVLDFGIAKVPAAGGAGPTQTGAMIGTAAYMSPEQARGELTLDGKADVYALGVLFYELLVGQRPFQAANDLALLYKHINAEPSSLLTHRPELGDELAALVHGMLSKDPKARPSMSEVAAATRGQGDQSGAVRLLRSGTGLRSRRWRKLSLMAVGVAALAGLVGLETVRRRAVTPNLGTTAIAPPTPSSPPGLPAAPPPATVLMPPVEPAPVTKPNEPTKVLEGEPIATTPPRKSAGMAAAHKPAGLPKKPQPSSPAVKNPATLSPAELRRNLFHPKP